MEPRPATDAQFDYAQLEDGREHNEDKDLVEDGSTDLQGRPVSRSRTGRWMACCFILVVQLIERLAHHGITSNLITYLTTVMHESTASSAKKINNWSGLDSVLPVLGAFVADAYWGKYWTIAVGSILYVLGLSTLSFAVSLSALRPPSCENRSLKCERASPAQLGFLFFTLYMISIGTSGIKPCLQAFGADQFEEEDLSEKRMKSSFFNWWNFGTCVGALLAATTLFYIQENLSWVLGFGIPAGAMLFALCIFIAGTPFYRHRRPGGSPLTRMAQVLVAAIRKWDVKVPANENLLYEIPDEEFVQAGTRRLLHTQEFVFLDKAATNDTSVHDLSTAFIGFRRLGIDLNAGDQGKTATNQHSNSKMQRSCLSPWRLCTVTQVEELKIIFRMVPIILLTIINGAAHAQSLTLFTKQGSTMITNITPSFKFSPASLQIFNFMVSLLLLPLYDRVFVPLVRWYTGNERGITMLQRIGVGMFLTIICMIVAALIEMKRLTVAKDYDLLDKPSQTIPMSIFWLLPQYVLVGISNVFIMVGKQEFFYDQVPDNIRSLGIAFFLLASGSGSFLSSILISIVTTLTGWGGHQSWFVGNLNRCHLDYFYWLLAVLTLLNLCVYMVVARSYTYKKVNRTL